MSFETRSPRRIAGISIALLVFGLSSQPVSAQVDPATRVRGLNNDLLRLHGEASQSQPGQADAQRVQAEQVIGQRSNALRDLIQRDPAQALSLAFSPATLAELAAAFPDSASQLESQGTWQGPIERWVADSADRTWSRT